MGLRIRTEVLLPVAALAIGCSHIEDTNGRNPGLETITVEKLASKSGTSRSNGVSSKSTRLRKTIMTEHEAEDVDSLARSGGKTSGVLTVMATQLREGDPLEIDCETRVDSGNLGLVLVDPSRKVLHEFSLGTKDAFTLRAKEAGIYEIRMGAESFSGLVKLQRSLD